MGHVMVTAFVSLDGVMTDPDGSAGTPRGGWAFRHGQQAVAGDKFRLGSVMEDGVMLLGRRTWELFAGLWPNRTDDFSARLNAMDKLVASKSLRDVSRWANSALVDGELLDAVRAERRQVVVTGSLSVVRLLQANDLVDEYRLLTFPTVVGEGERLFPAETASPQDLTLVSTDQVGAAILSCYQRAVPREG
jgi:dihydrofolate reductase